MRATYSNALVLGHYTFVSPMRISHKVSEGIKADEDEVDAAEVWRNRYPGERTQMLKKESFHIDRTHKHILGFCWKTITMLAVATLPICATTVTLTVPGVADIWLAAQPNGSTLGDDVAPTNSPLLGSGGLRLTAGTTLMFSATGSTSLFGSVGGVGSAPTPDGILGLDTVSANNLSGFAGPNDALIGVFIGSGVPTGSAPAALDFSTTAAQSAGTISPLLQQVFFIGDGLTGKGSGSSQQFTIPVGATRLFLGSSDTVGNNFNNSGFFSVNVSDDNNGLLSGAPEPGDAALLGFGAIFLLVARMSVNRTRKIMRSKQDTWLTYNRCPVALLAFSIVCVGPSSAQTLRDLYKAKKAVTPAPVAISPTTPTEANGKTISPAIH